MSVSGNRVDEICRRLWDRKFSQEDYQPYAPTTLSYRTATNTIDKNIEQILQLHEKDSKLVDFALKDVSFLLECKVCKSLFDSLDELVHHSTLRQCHLHVSEQSDTNKPLGTMERKTIFKKMRASISQLRRKKIDNLTQSEKQTLSSAEIIQSFKDAESNVNNIGCFRMDRLIPISKYIQSHTQPKFI